MKAVMAMFDSLNRRMLPPYGCDWVHAPNFARLAARSVTFTNAHGPEPAPPASSAAAPIDSTSTR